MGFIDLVEKIFGSYNDKEVNKLMKTVDEIEALESQMQSLSDDELKNKTDEFKGRLNNGETLDDLLVEAFAVVREAAVRTLGLRPYRVQLLGGIVLHQGRIAEMKTGEGKTLVATLPVYLNALTEKGVHVITVNDYLAQRDKEWMGKVYEYLGLSVGCVTNDVKGDLRKKAYHCDITYGTNNEFGFDYLRDNMVVRKEEMMQRPLNYAIIDEVDSILIDEARTPLIISGKGAKSTNLYQIANQFVNTLIPDDYEIDEKAKSVVLTDESGVEKAEKYFSLENLSDPKNMEIAHHINQAMKAKYIMKKDYDYVVKEGQVLIVDSFTGRIMNGRRYSNGLHQAIEAKENLNVKRESQTLSTITLQNYFRMYNKNSGMTATAKTEEDEFKHIYGMDVVVIPTNKPVQRIDKPDVIYKSVKGKFDAIIEDVIEKNKQGRPVLVGTVSIEVSELISKLLKKRGIKHEVLNAKQHEREAEIVAQAGRLGAITIATNMAGRGTDIVLGGNADFMAQRDLLKDGYSHEIVAKVTSPLKFDDPEVIEAKKAYKEYMDKHKAVFDVEAKKVKEIGGLHIIGTERHESRRIDNQLRGRSGRQGDKGSSQFFISLEDDLMRLFMSDKVKDMVGKLGMEDDMPIEAKILTKSIESAQSKVEGRNFSIRKHVLQYDDVMNKQREIIYAERQSVLQGEDIKDQITGMIDEIISNAVELYTAEGKYPEEWDIKGLVDHLHQIYLPRDRYIVDDLENLTREKLKEDLIQIAREIYKEKEELFTAERLREVERFILLKVVDKAWIDHIDAMDQLKQGIGLRAVGNEDPIRAYKMEGFDMFNDMTKRIQEDTVKYLFAASLEIDTSKREKAAVITNMSSKGKASKPKTVVKEDTVGRNDPCPCGSGKKYKKCCGRL